MSSPTEQSRLLRVRRLFWRTSLQRKLLLLFVSLFAFGVVVNYLLYSRLSTRLHDVVVQRLGIDAAPEIASRLQELLDRDAPYDQLVGSVEAIYATNPAYAIFILNGGGKIVANLASFVTDLKLDYVPLEPLERFIANPASGVPSYALSPASGRPEIFSAAPILLGGQKGFVYVLLEGSLPFERAQGVSRENIFLSQIVSLGAFVTIVTIAIALFSLVAISRRLFRLISTVREYEQGNFAVRLEERPGDEIDELGSAVNRMADTIQSNIQELRNRDELRRKLITDVAHDLRGPLTSLRLNTSALRQAVADEGNPLDSIAVSLTTGTKRLERLLTELFELSKLEARQSPPEKVLFPLGELIEELSHLHSSTARERKISLTTAIAAGNLIAVCDPNLITRAASNLVENALRYTPEGGRVEIGAMRENGRIRVFVADTGIGIAAEEKSELFQRFARGKGGVALGDASVGLGLAIVQAIIELHGSSIEVSSEAGKGSTFSFELEAAPEKLAAASVESENT